LLRRLAAVLALAALGGAGAPAAVGTIGAGTAAVCRDVDVPVSLALLLPATVHGRLCLPAGGAQPDSVQLLVHGGTYNGTTYWDVEYRPELYSYVRAANARGIATFAIDRVGYGASSKPPGVTLTGVVHADTVHQIVGRLRSGAVSGTPFSKVVLVGHSLGSGTALLAASTYGGVDGLVLTGMTHHQSPAAVADAILNKTYPAPLDPRFAGSLDLTYLTTVPGVRGEFFYSARDRAADPGLVAYDEATKDRVTPTEIADISAIAFTLPVSLAIDVPVLLAVGSQDNLFCLGLGASNCTSEAALLAEERPFFAPAACLRATVLPQAGHDLNMAPDTAVYRDRVFDWTQAVVETGAPPGGCTQP
jgi:pimeloyl-ACP methyl ester carboxylesterase